MRLDELEEAEVKKAVFTFGRLNPPHFGHHALIQTLQKTAEKQGCDWFLFVSSKTGDEKNPLTYEQKVWWIQALFPETKGHLVIDPSIKTPLVAATWIFKKGYNAATFVAGEDDMSSYGEMIKSGNAHGQKNPDAVKAGKGFVFNTLDFAISPRLASATNARRNVTDGDPEAFVRSILGPKINPKLAELVHDQLYPTVRKALGLSESVGESAELNKTTPSVRDLAKKYATDPAEIHRQVNRGVKVEFEHTNDIEVATEIAMDHLKEKLDYYDLLNKLETTPKKKFGENFADGKGPGRPGDSQRHGIPKGATISQLEKASHATGRKGQLARWQLNMRRGKKKSNEEVTNEVADQPYRFISPVSTATTQKSMFNTDSGTTIQVFIQVDTGNGVADIGFFDATDKENPTIGVTGKGDAFRVFATVGSIVKQFVAKRKPPYISFSGKSSDAGRIKLYDMIAKNIGRYLPEYKLIDSGFANGDKGYTFKRVAQESVSEVAKVKLSSDPNNFGAWVNDSGKPEKTIMIPINKLSVFEPDSKFDDPSHAKNLAKIVKAIKAGKELPPILVRRHGIDRFQVLDGHHRFKAYRMAGMKSIPARLVDPKNVSEEKKPKKPKTIIDGALKTLIAKGRSEDEAIADLKKEIDGKFYDLTETREGALNWLKSYLPSWPEYVLRDWLYRNLTSKEHDPKAVVDRSLAGEGMSAQTQWKLISNFEFKIEKLHPDTQRRINIRAGGSANPMKVPKDAERHATQAALAQQQGGVRKEPVIGKMTPQGFELIEGWHRTIQHFAQFPNGYTGPAWVAMNAKTESWSPMELAIMEGGHLLEEHDESLDETLKKVKGEWALVSRHDPKKVLQYYHGSGHPSKDWVSKVERRVHSFESIMEDDAKPRVYLDMDGVLADFFGEWARLAKVDHYKDINDPEENLQLVRDHPTFWVDLPMLPHAKALIKTVIEQFGEYRICSKPLEGDTRSKPGKMAWIKKHLSDMMPVEVILTANKAAFAKNEGDPNILVDDFGVNIDAWKAAGGIGIKYDDSQFPKVANILTKLAK
jgi:5'(3')-deoxyribonucleotidase